MRRLQLQRLRQGKLPRRFRLAGQDLELVSPQYVSLQIDLEICVDPDYFQSDVKQALLAVLGNQILPNGQKGLFFPDNFTFGQVVYLSLVYAAARSVAGVRAVRAVHFQPQGASNLSEACHRFALTHRQKGVCVILSDFFDKGGYENGLRYVAGGKYDLFGVQILSPQEIEPDLQGDLKLRDMEDDDMAEVSITQPLLKQYKANLNAYCLGLKDYVTRRGGTYLFTSTAVPFDTLVLNYLRERGLLG